MTFGYDADIFTKASSRRSFTFAEDLLSSLMDKRLGPASGRHRDKKGKSFERSQINFIQTTPLTEAKCLLIAQSNQGQYHDLLSSVHHLMFFGTPHQGANGTPKFLLNLGSALTGSKDGSVTKELELWSSSLLEANALFTGIADNFTITTFFEREKYKNIQIVTEGSARLDKAKERVIGLDANHMTMCKFENQEDPLYETVVARLQAEIFDMRTATGISDHQERVRRLLEILILTDFTPGSILPQGLPLLRNDAIFLQDRLLVRNDLESFLTDAVGSNKRVRIVLHGLPGVGKSTVARSFAYSSQKSMAVLWIPGHSEAAIKQAFEQYARQICGNDQQSSEPMSLLERSLSERFPNQWLVVFDGLDVPLLNIQQYLFADIEESKILITTRNKDIASCIRNPHVFQMNPLDERLGQDLLDMYMNTASASFTAGRAAKAEQNSQERDARLRIVQELEGLPLAIAIVGVALRNENDGMSTTSHAYLAWADRLKDDLLEDDPLFSDYSTSVWKAFEFAFRTILSGTGIKRYAASMARFSASCEDASNIAEYIRLYRKVRSKEVEGIAGHDHPDISRLHFLEMEKLKLAVKALAAASMVTVNWKSDTDVPHIEIHSLVKRWLRRTDHDEVVVYTGPKAWLIGSSVYTHVSRGRIGMSQIEPLLKEVRQALLRSSKMPGSKDPSVLGAALALILDAQMKLTPSFDLLPAASAQRKRLLDFSNDLESELSVSYIDTLEGVAWVSIFQNWAPNFAEVIGDIVQSDAAKVGYGLQHFFTDSLDSSGCIISTFEIETYHILRKVGRTAALGSIQVKIVEHTRPMLVEHLNSEAFEGLPGLASDESGTLTRIWVQKWTKDVMDIIRKCLGNVFTDLHYATSPRGLASETFSSSFSTAVPTVQSSEDAMQAYTDPNDSRNAFFAILRRVLKRATRRYLDDHRISEQLDKQMGFFRGLCEAAVRKGFGDRAADVFLDTTLRIDGDTPFHRLWELAWHSRILGTLEDLMAEVTFTAISDDLKNAAKQGFQKTLTDDLDNSSSFAKKLADEVFSEPGMAGLFLNWTRAGWIDPPGEVEGSDDEDSFCDVVTHRLKQQTMTAMESVYCNLPNVADESAVNQVLSSMLDSRRFIHDMVLNRLNDPEISDRTGMGPFFAMLGFKGCDTSFRLACAVVGNEMSQNIMNSLDDLIHVEKMWLSESDIGCQASTAGPLDAKRLLDRSMRVLIQKQRLPDARMKEL
ncbi:hypothetical protein LTR56_012281 [Elasticomyces elasticus]|nr:hypothetical protein LTR22_021046 [Elasticomyces elasticus]KAK3639704.1 hypothetical protein LTR56_012281 [Elasticomyces elasticus]KAK4922566.1 hypothetical protein LTR49_010093 [Elasticomyces elasticus]KAK5760739.1 hypothetical protein LTS12_009097 [Elasticomyces elasticus]